MDKRAGRRLQEIKSLGFTSTLVNPPESGITSHLIAPEPSGQFFEASTFATAEAIAPCPLQIEATPRRVMSARTRRPSTDAGQHVSQRDHVFVVSCRRPELAKDLRIWVEV